MTRASDLARLLGAGATINDGTTITTADNTTQLTLTSTDADSSFGPILELARDSASPADGDAIGQIKFVADNDAGQATDYGTINGTLRDASDGTEDAQIQYNAMVGGSSTDFMRYGVGGDGEIGVIFNEGSIDSDFRVESNDNTHAFFVEGSTGDVGIGPSTINKTLHIAKSTTSTDGTVYPGLQIENTSAGSGNSYANIVLHGGNATTQFSILADGRSSNSDVYIRTDTATPLLFLTNGSERMRIHSGGAISAGTTSAGSHQFVYEAATGGNAVTKIRNSSANTSNQICLLLSINERTDTNSAFLQGNNGYSNYYLFANGTHSFTSDENRKKNIETTRDGYLEDLAKLRVVKYNWKEDEDGADKELGLIAQEVEKVFPKLVMEDPQDASDTDETKFKMIKTSVLPMMLLKALQEANTKITALEAKINSQETNINDLQKRVTALEGS